MPTAIVRPVAAGNKTQLTVAGDTLNWHAVSEVTPDDTNSHVSSLDTTLYQTDLYKLGKYSGSGIIQSVTVHFRCFTGGVTINQASAKASILVGGTQYNGTAVTLPDGGWNTYSTTWSTSPKTGVAWTWDEIVALQGGVSLRSPTAGVTNASYCTQLYATYSFGSSVTGKFGSQVEGGLFRQKPSPSKEIILLKERLKRGGRNAREIG